MYGFMFPFLSVRICMCLCVTSSRGKDFHLGSASDVSRCLLRLCSGLISSLFISEAVNEIMLVYTRRVPSLSSLLPSSFLTCASFGEKMHSFPLRVRRFLPCPCVCESEAVTRWKVSSPFTADVGEMDERRKIK